MAVVSVDVKFYILFLLMRVDSGKIINVLGFFFFGCRDGKT